MLDETKRQKKLIKSQKRKDKFLLGFSKDFTKAYNNGYDSIEYGQSKLFEGKQAITDILNYMSDKFPDFEFEVKYAKYTKASLFSSETGWCLVALNWKKKS